jgi:HSP20 family protein
MNDTSKVPVKTEKSAAPTSAPWHPFEAFRQEVDRLCEDFGRSFRPFGFGRRSELSPFWSFSADLSPAVDVVDKGTSWQITAELPGLDEKNVEVTVADNILTIKGEKKEEKEEKRKGYYRSERSFGTFQRSFELPESVDQNKITAGFQKGLLTLTLPKKPEAHRLEKKIEVKAG